MYGFESQLQQSRGSRVKYMVAVILVGLIAVFVPLFAVGGFSRKKQGD